MHSLAVAFTGPSNSGKTTAILNIANILSKKYKLSIIKHDPKDKAVFDTQGKDSFKFSQTGAKVVVTSPKKTTLLTQQNMNLDEIINLLMPFDFLFVEGLKNLPLPRIGIFRNKIDDSYLPFCDAIAIDESIDIKQYTLSKSLHVLPLNDPLEQISWIQKHAKRIQNAN